MKKLLVGLLVVVVLAGCSESLKSVDMNKGVQGVDTITTLCLEGVEYYFYLEGYRATMSVKIDRETLEPSTCK